MKSLLLLLLVGLMAGCARTHQPSVIRVLRDADWILGRERDVAKFESRLDELGARIEKGSSADERLATVALPGKPGYFPPRTLQIVYVITDRGRVEIRSVDVTALGSSFARM